MYARTYALLRSFVRCLSLQVRRGEVDDVVLRYFGARVRPLLASHDIAPTKLFCVNKYVPGG